MQRTPIDGIWEMAYVKVIHWKLEFLLIFTVSVKNYRDFVF